MGAIGSLIILLFALTGHAAAAVLESFARDEAPALLTFDELLTLAITADPEGELADRLGRLLYTPFVGNAAARRGVSPRRPERDSLGPVLRAALWNVDRGKEFELVRDSLAGPDVFLETAGSRGALDPDTLAQARIETALLMESDIVVLNEVDLGMKRTGYRDVARDLAAELNMNYAFGVEFVEVDRIELGLERFDLPDDELEETLHRDLEVDPQQYRGLHGSAVLSRYPILRARIHRLPICYDWFGEEKREIAKIEHARRWTADRVFLERISREVRHGGRMALLADILVPESPTGVVTVVTAHLENKTRPQCRQKQMSDLLHRIAEVENPLILAGDFNTTNSDGAPATVRREIAKRVKNPRFWIAEAIRWFTPVGAPRLFTMPANYFKNFRDPTATHLPLFATNHESGLFKAVEKFRFADGRTFDLRGDKHRSQNGRGRTLANSNQRGAKGFTPTFAFQRDLRGMVGRMRLDWILVAPLIEHPRKRTGSYHFAPHLPHTLEALNQAVPDRISDHHPITVDLPLMDPSGMPPMATGK
jgi:endonuclease/exonuclease/phosphatase family metal-dependent hydrolase